MYRIMMARNGYYYVQRPILAGVWRKIGGFFRTRAGAENLIRDLKGLDGVPPYIGRPRLIGYY